MPAQELKCVNIWRRRLVVYAWVESPILKGKDWADVQVCVYTYVAEIFGHSSWKQSIRGSFVHAQHTDETYCKLMPSMDAESRLQGKSDFGTVSKTRKKQSGRSFVQGSTQLNMIETETRNNDLLPR